MVYLDLEVVSVNCTRELVYLECVDFKPILLIRLFEGRNFHMVGSIYYIDMHSVVMLYTTGHSNRVIQLSVYPTVYCGVGK